MDGIYKLYPHETKKNIDACIAELDQLGWVYYRKTQAIDGNKKDIPNVRRSRKQMYNEQRLFDE